MGYQHNRKLSYETAALIRREYAEARGMVTYMQLAARYGCSEATIARIVKGRTYTENMTAYSQVIDYTELARKVLEVQRSVDANGPQFVAGVSQAARPETRRTGAPVSDEVERKFREMFAAEPPDDPPLGESPYAKPVGKDAGKG